MTRTLEDKLAVEIEALYIDATMLHRGDADGRQEAVTIERLDYMARRLAEAREIQVRIEKRDARRARFARVREWAEQRQVKS